MYDNESPISWEEITKAICKSFGNKDDIVEEFNKLEQDKRWKIM
jgi:hypothetical protein